MICEILCDIARCFVWIVEFDKQRKPSTVKPIYSVFQWYFMWTNTFSFWSNRCCKRAPPRKISQMLNSQVAINIFVSFSTIKNIYHLTYHPFDEHSLFWKLNFLLNTFLSNYCDHISLQKYPEITLWQMYHIYTIHTFLIK